MSSCPNCGMKNDNQAQFCFNCGVSLTVNNDAGGPTPLALNRQGPADDLPRVDVKFNKQTILVLAGVAVLICTYFVYSFLTRPLPPATVATRFMDALKSGDYAKAYGYFDDTGLIGKPLLTKDFFVQSFQAKKVRDYRITFPQDNSSSDSNQQSYSTVMDFGGNRREIDLILINHSAQKPQWKIDPSSFITSTQIQAPTGANVTVNGEPVQLDNGNGDLDTYINCALQISLANPDIKPVQVQAMAGDNVSLTDVEPNENLKAQLTQLVSNFNQAWINAVKNYDMAPLAPFVKRDSDAWNMINSYMERLKSDGKHQEDQLVSVSQVQVRFGDNLNTILYDNDEYWASQIIFKDGSVNQQPSHLNRWTYIIEKQSDGSWLIVDSNERY